MSYLPICLLEDTVSLISTRGSSFFDGIENVFDSLFPCSFCADHPSSIFLLGCTLLLTLLGCTIFFENLENCTVHKLPYAFPHQCFSFPASHQSQQLCLRHTRNILMVESYPNIRKHHTCNSFKKQRQATSPKKIARPCMPYQQLVLISQGNIAAAYFQRKNSSATSA